MRDRLSCRTGRYESKGNRAKGVNKERPLLFPIALIFLFFRILHYDGSIL
jgi:hypothetical protein